MLSDSKLLDRLREELGKMAAPVHADARVFQTKITEASERLQVCRGQGTPAGTGYRDTGRQNTHTCNVCEWEWEGRGREVCNPSRQKKRFLLYDLL